MERALREANRDGQLNSSNPIPAFHVRWLNPHQVSASSARQALYSFPTEAVAEAGLQVASTWWFPVPRNIDPRGWRYASLRWFT